MKSGYPETQGKKGSALPDYESPLNVNHDPGDKLVPPNDMAGVAPTFAMGKSCPDPLGLLTPIEKVKK